MDSSTSTSTCTPTCSSSVPDPPVWPPPARPERPGPGRCCSMTEPPPVDRCCRVRQRPSTVCPRASGSRPPLPPSPRRRNSRTERTRPCSAATTRTTSSPSRTAPLSSSKTEERVRRAAPGPAPAHANGSGTSEPSRSCWPPEPTNARSYSPTTTVRASCSPPPCAPTSTASVSPLGSPSRSPRRTTLPTNCWPICTRQASRCRRSSTPAPPPRRWQNLLLGTREPGSSSAPRSATPQVRGLPDASARSPSRASTSTVWPPASPRSSTWTCWPWPADSHP